MFPNSFICLIVLFSGLLEQLQNNAYAVLLQSLYNHTVPVISAETLKNSLENKQAFYLIDTRSDKEFEVSHLQGSIRMNFDRLDEKQLKNIPKNATIVVYCTVGYRSEKAGEKLLKTGYEKVYNLYGGIFDWVNNGYEVVDANGPTNKVHVYSKKWGIWLQKGVKVYE